jgi:hypothetical protein
VDLVAREIHVPKLGTDWRVAMRQRAISMREVVLRHPWAARLIESRKTLGFARLRLLDATLGSLTGAGFSIEDAARAVLLMDSYIYGFTLQETSWQFDTSSPASAAAETLGPDVTSFPHLIALMTHITSEPGRDSFASLPLEFEVGFDLILDAIKPWHPRSHGGKAQTARETHGDPKTEANEGQEDQGESKLPRRRRTRHRVAR